jgi:hypothetical protein
VENSDFIEKLRLENGIIMRITPYNGHYKGFGRLGNPVN